MAISDGHGGRKMQMQENYSGASSDSEQVIYLPVMCKRRAPGLDETDGFRAVGGR